MIDVVDRTDAAPAQRSGKKLRSSTRGRRRYPDRTSLDETQRDLASRFLPLARRLSRPMKVLFPFWRDEFESAACLALVEAARVYDPERAIKFSTFARIRIQGAIRDVGRAMILPGFGRSRNAPDVLTMTPYTEEHGAVLVAAEPPPVGQETDDIDEVEGWLRKLPERHAHICRLYYIYGKTQMEIAESVGCSQSEVTRLHKRAIELLSRPDQARTKSNQAKRARIKRQQVDLEQPARKPRNQVALAF